MSAARNVTDDSSTPTDSIHKCDTVPPPDGEDDAYNAPTKMSPMARGLVEQLMAQAEAMVATGTFESAPPPKSGERALKARRGDGSQAPALIIPPPAAIPRVYDDIDDADDEGNRLDPTSLVVPNLTGQSGGTKLLDITESSVREAYPRPASAPASVPVHAPAADVADALEAAPAPVQASAPSVRPLVFAPLLDISSFEEEPAKLSSAAQLVISLGAIVAVLSLVALAVYLLFFASVS